MRDLWTRHRAVILGWASNLLGLAVLVWFASYLWDRRAQLESALRVSSVHVVALATVIALGWVLTAAQSAVLYRAAGTRIGFGENFLLTIGSAFASYLPMLAGTLLRFHYMKSIHGLRYARSGSVSWLRAILLTLSTAALGLIGTGALMLVGNVVSTSLILLLIGLLVLPLLVFVWPSPGERFNRLPGGRILRDLFDGMEALRRERRNSVLVFLFIMLQQLCLAARLAIAADATGQSLPLPLLFIMAPSAVFVSFISVTPAALGLREAVMGYVTYATGYSFGSGLFMGAVDRAILLVMVTLFGGSSLLYLWHRIRAAEALRHQAPSIAAEPRS